MNQLISIERKNIRDSILEFESVLSEHPSAVFGDSDLMPLKHTFADGIYVRQITIPKGTILTGKIHKHSHPNFLLEGEVDVFTEGGGWERLKAPMSIISAPGTKRVVFAHTKCVWTTIHHNPKNLTDLSKLEDLIIAKDFEEYDKFRKSIENKSILKRFIIFCKKFKLKIQ